MSTYKKKLNPITGELDYVVDTYTETDPLSLKLDQTTPQTINGGIPVSVHASAPATPAAGTLYVNSVDNKVYIYYSGSWQALHTLSVGVDSYLLLETSDFLLLEDGVSKLVLEA